MTVNVTERDHVTAYVNANGTVTSVTKTWNPIASERETTEGPAKRLRTKIRAKTKTTTEVGPRGRERAKKRWRHPRELSLAVV